MDVFHVPPGGVDLDLELILGQPLVGLGVSERTYLGRVLGAVGLNVISFVDLLVKVCAVRQSMIRSRLSCTAYASSP